MKYYFLLLAFAFLFSLDASCQHKAENIEIPECIINEVRKIASTPDSLLTSAQINLKKKLSQIMKSSLKLEKNKIVNKSKPEDFEKQGLSKYYYYLLEKNVDEFNNSEPYNKSIEHDIINQLNQFLKE
jgi:hypothetical protein